MATLTNNLGLTKPSYSDHQDISVINENMDKIDNAVAGKVPLSGGTLTGALKAPSFEGNLAVEMISGTNSEILAGLNTILTGMKENEIKQVGIVSDVSGITAGMRFHGRLIKTTNDHAVFYADGYKGEGMSLMNTKYAGAWKGWKEIVITVPYLTNSLLTWADAIPVYSTRYGYISSSVTDSPTTYGSVTAIRGESVITLMVSDDKTVYVNRKISGSWGGWKQLATTDGTIANANHLNYYAGNEINFYGVPEVSSTWFNYRDAATDNSSGNTPIERYYFGNKNASTSGVTLEADYFTGSAAGLKLNSSNYGTSLPSAGIAGRVFFKKV